MTEAVIGRAWQQSMKTKQIYYDDPYKKELDSKVLSIEQGLHLTNVILDQTIFYPEGGGQPSDRGTLGNTKVEYVRFSNGEIIHQVKGNISKGEQIKTILDWNWRYKHMKIHSAGHLLHDALMTMTKDLTPIKGGHGKKAFIEYKGVIDPSIKEKLEAEVNKTLQHGLEIVTRFVTYDELANESQFLTPNLPRNKPLRMIKIGNYPAMADGGVQVKNTKEIGKIWIANITVQNGITSIRYGVV